MAIFQTKTALKQGIAAIVAMGSFWGGSGSAQAAGDLLVAPTRVVLDGSRGTEVILNNIGAETATYRISLELRRMTEEGKLADVTPEEANALETAALEMIRYAPRRVTLPPNQPQAIRIGVRPPEGLADGEYRAHLLFRAIPDAAPVGDEQAGGEGFAVKIIPIYGVTIPVIIRQGRLSATAAIANARIEKTEHGQAFAVDMSRTGNRSTYGELRVLKPGVSEPLFVARGVAVYPEINARTFSLPVPPELAAQMTGAIRVEYWESDVSGSNMVSAIDARL
jgi:P pilus assembly chaperone PapD